MASMVFGSIGSSLLGPIGGMIGSAIGSALDQRLFGGAGNQEGQRINDVNVARADPGSPIPLLYGADRLPGIIIASTPLIETKHKQRAGKGGPEVTTYTYHVDIDYLLCEGPILGVARIWAEGNLIRSTRYEMDLSTSEYPQNIGGIPYPDYYRDHLYYPSLIPWTLNVNKEPNASNNDGKYYTTSADCLAMREISSTVADGYMSSRDKIVYWRDGETGYYIPMHTDHAYQASKYTKVKHGKPKSVSGEFEHSQGVYNGTPESTVCDLGPDASEYFTGGTILIEAQSATYTDWYLGLPGYARVMTYSVDFYKDGNNTDVDGKLLGSLISSVSAGISVEQEGVYNTKLVFDVPAGTRYFVINTSYAIWFPIAGGGLYAGNSTYTVSYYDKGDVNERVRDWPDYWNLYDAINDWSKIAVLAYKGADNVTVYHGTYDQEPNQAMETSLEVSYPAYVGRAHIVFKKLQLVDYGNRVPSLTFECVQFDDVRVKDVLRDLMQRALIDDKYFDLDLLASEADKSHVLGYSISSQVSFRQAIETINEAFMVDCSEIGEQLVFRQKDRDYDWQIDMLELGAIEPGRGVEELVQFTYRDQLEMPRTLTVRFKDVERLYQSNTTMYQREYTPSVQESSVELASVLPPAKAKSYARDKMRDTWLERTTVSFKLPHRYVYVYPTDVVTLLGASYGLPDITIKVSKVTRGVNGVLEIEGNLRDLQRYVKQAGETDNLVTDNLWNQGGARDTFTVYETLMYLADLPPLRNVDVAKPGFYLALNAEIGWGGASVGRAIPPANDPWTTVLSSPYRTATGNVVLGSALEYHIAELPDTDFALIVDLDTDDQELVNATFDEICMGKNLCMVGSELIQFMNVAQVANTIGKNRWQLTNIFRGRRLTDRYEVLSGHQELEPFILMDVDGVRCVEDDLNNMGRTLSYRAASTNSDPADSDIQEFAWTFERDKRPQPVYITGERDGSNNLTIKWIKQDIGILPFYDQVNVLGSDATLNFEIDIYNAAGDTIVRTIRKSYTAAYDDQALGGFQTYEYTAADQTADGLTPGDPVIVAIYQTSQYAGRGYPGNAEV